MAEKAPDQPAIATAATTTSTQASVVLPFRNVETTRNVETAASQARQETAPPCRSSFARQLVSQRQIAAGLLLLPSVLTAAFASFVASRRDAPIPAPAAVAMANPMRAVERLRDVDFAAILPQPVLPTRPPAIDTLGEIRFAALKLPATPPDMPPSLSIGAIPPRPFAVARTAPEISAPSISFAAVTASVPAPPITIPLLPSDLRPANSDFANAAPVEQCVAEAGFTLQANPKLPLPSVAPADETPEQFGLRLAQAARTQTASLVIYNARYSRIAYPGGDVSQFYGVCTDVIVRAYRSLGVDLQIEIAEAGVGTGDRNIDHRRTEVMRKFLAKRGQSLAISDNPDEFKPGDIVTYYRPQNRSSTSHIAIVSDIVGPSGQPMIVHNRGWGVQLEDALFVDKITGHYRYVGRAKPAADALAAVRPSPSISAKPALSTNAEAQRIKPKTPGGSTLAKAGATGRALP